MNQILPVRLMDPVLHRLEDHLRLRRRLSERIGQQHHALHVERHVPPAVAFGQHGARFGCADFVVGDYHERFDVGGPAEFYVVAYGEWGGWGPEPGVDAAGWGGEDFGEGDFFSGHG